MGSLLGMRNTNCKPPLTGYSTDNNQNGNLSSLIHLLPVFLFFFSIGSSEEVWLEQKNSCWILSVNKENLLTFWICSDFFLPDKEISVFHICFARQAIYSLWIQNCKLDFSKYTHRCHWYLVSDSVHNVMSRFILSCIGSIN